MHQLVNCGILQRLKKFTLSVGMALSFVTWLDNAFFYLTFFLFVCVCVCVCVVV